MLAVITRPMVIATDAGTAKQFLVVKDKGGEHVPQAMSEGEFNRLRRAGAAQRFIEVNHAEAETESAEGTSVQALAQSDLGRDGDSSSGAQAKQSETGSGSTGSEGAASGVTSQLPVKPVAKPKGRKPKA